MRDAEGSAAVWLVTEVTRLTSQWNPDTATITRALAASAPCCGVAYTIVGGLGGCPAFSSIESRFIRAGLPSPKRQLVLFRLALAVAIRSRGVRCAAHIAQALECSSSSAFVRHVRQTTGMLPGGFFARWPEPSAFWLESVAPVLRWEDERWVTFNALEGSGRAAALRERATVALYGSRPSVGHHPTCRQQRQYPRGSPMSHDPLKRLRELGSTTLAHAQARLDLAQFRCADGHYPCATLPDGACLGELAACVAELEANEDAS